MRISSQQDVDVVNGKFNHFHDGFIKQIRVTSDNEFLTDMPWEEQRQFASNQEELHAAGLCFMNTTTVDIEIHHYNYDWPNQPRTRAIMVRACSARVSDRLLSFLGSDIFDLTFLSESAGISCVLTYHEDTAGPLQTRSMENGLTVVLFSAPEMEITESTWAEQHAGQVSSEAAPSASPDEPSA
jgi:hypothetical protein